MRKIIKYLSIMLFAFLLVGCSLNDKNINPVIEIGQSTKFSEEEINNAVD